MDNEQREACVEDLAKNWQAGTSFDEITTHLTEYFSGVADDVELLMESTAETLEDYHAKFAAELTADLIEHEELDVNHMADSEADGEVKGFLIEVFHMEGRFGCPTEGFAPTHKRLSDLLERWASEAGPLYRKNGAAYLHKLADQMAEKVAT